jgi:hypothetical protein
VFQGIANLPVRVALGFARQLDRARGLPTAIFCIDESELREIEVRGDGVELADVPEQLQTIDHKRPLLRAAA